MGKKSANAEKKLPPLKPILALPTWGQMWILSELWVLEKGNFDLGHPVVLVFSLFLIYWFESISITQIIQPQYFIDFFVP